ncbi:type VI secretion system baseplate subunit TssF [Desulfoluna butyratoxydans]|uniref:Type vi secretion system tssf n=1 Tax=Desulfoluna butyratoxydans TaxID=231438 RepID=A0A4U8YNS3_9BACT|nr:type VI secretion system baseplate subunit TssF [Desulfoluna butyratoxydans]VFQ44899.1 type vi secretion system tssf [Desulfoluna butyratoxydans]
MFNYYFQNELSHLKEIGTAFARENPAIAPMLGEPSADPDVDRLLEGVAFLTGSIRQKIDDEFPEIIHNVIRQVWPHYLRPIPATTMMVFSPGEGTDAVASVSSGAEVDSVAVDGTACRFRTCTDVVLPPVSVVRAGYEETADGTAGIRVTLSATGRDDWKADSLRFYIGGGYAEASDLYCLLLTGLRRVVVGDGSLPDGVVLGPESLRPKGFSEEESLIPWPSTSFDGYRLLQEFFVLPEKFLFVELTGLSDWRAPKDDGEVDIWFELEAAPEVPLRVDASRFMLSVAPAVNVFSHDADPVLLRAEKNEYRVRPTAPDLSHYQVYSLVGVSAYMAGSGEVRPMKPFHSLAIDETDVVYSEILTTSPVRQAMDVSISIATPGGREMPEFKSLSFDVLCTNGFLPEQLLAGDISVATTRSPEGVAFRNLRKPTSAVLPPLGTNALWPLISMMNLNQFCLSRLENFKAMLGLFLLDGHGGRRVFAASEKRIDGIVGLETENTRRLFRGVMVSGVLYRVAMRRDHFAGMGDLYLFSTVLDRFLGLSAALNTFTQLVVTEVGTGEVFTWQERMGEEALG